MRRMYSLEQLKKVAQEVASSGELKNVKVFEEIVDNDGHKRFIEGDIPLNPTLAEGITSSYGKWSLSGSHLLIVLCITAVVGTQISGDIALFNLPEWITNKIIRIAGQYVDNKTVTLLDSNLSGQNLGVYLRKYDTGLMAINTNNLTIASTDKTGRIAFDISIDND